MVRRQPFLRFSEKLTAAGLQLQIVLTATAGKLRLGFATIAVFLGKNMLKWHEQDDFERPAQQ